MDELGEQIQIIDEQLLHLERDGYQADTIEHIFRAAHTLKGSSAAMGFAKMTELTHHMENVLERIRNRQLSVDSSVVSAVFRSLDLIKSMNLAIGDGTLEQIDITEVKAQLRDLQQSGAAHLDYGNTSSVQVNALAETLIASLDEHQIDAMREAERGGYRIIALTACMSSDQEMKSARALIVFNHCQSLGEVVAAFPSVETIQEEEEFTGELAYLIFTNKSDPEIESEVGRISHVERLDYRFLASDQLGEYRIEHQPIASSRASVEVEQESESESRVKDTKVRVNQTVRVDVNRLEQLLNFVGELIIDNTRLQEVKNKLVGQFRDHPDLMSLHDISNHLSRVISELQEGMMKTRMMPIEQLFNRFPRMVRDIAEQLNKEIDLIVQGKETELDRTLIEEISDPIIHLLRNAADHGIELPDERERVGKPRRGKLIIRAEHVENQIVISIADDGKGIDPEKIKRKAIQRGFITEEDASRMGPKELVFLIFKSGMSTADVVTDLSGRGVGMDIVRAQIEKLNGIIDIDTSPGEGTVFTIKMPLTLAINRSLLVRQGEVTFAIPLVNVVETVRLAPDQITTIQGQEVCVIRGSVFPLIRMSQKLNLPSSQEGTSRKGTVFVVIAGIADKRVCLVVDRMIGNQEIVIKSLGSYLGKIPYISGGTILGGGDVALILDIGSFVRDVGSKTNLHAAYEETDSSRVNRERQFITFVLGTEPYGLDIDAVKEIVAVPEISPLATSSSQVLGLINLRGKLVTVFDFRQCLHMPSQPVTSSSKIIVLETVGHEIGIMVDEVTDVLKIHQDDIEPAPNRIARSNPKAIRGVYKKDGRIVILLDAWDVLDLQDIPSYV